jgi:hypothetical protein
MALNAQEKGNPLPGETQLAYATMGVGYMADSSWQGRIAYLKWYFTTRQGWFGDYVSFFSYCIQS